MFCFISALWLAAACLHVSAAPPPPPPFLYPLSTTKVTTCDTLGNVHRLSCDEGVIVVQTALYRETCSKDQTNDPSNVNCSQTDTKDVLKNSCDGKTTCEVESNAFRSSSPCSGTYKYLESTYACVRTRRCQPALNSSVVCEGSTAHLRCGQGQVIRVSSAVYGRQDTSTCSFGQHSSKLQDVTCGVSATSAKLKVDEKCNDQSSCFVKADNTFGDPCAGTYKYLNVTYTCNNAAV